MKKLMIVLCVLFVVSTGFCTVIDIVADGIGDMGHTGSIGNPLVAGETIAIVIALNQVPGSYPGNGPTGLPYPYYDGYVLNSIYLDIATTGTSSIDLDFGKKGNYVNYDALEWAIAPAMTADAGANGSFHTGQAAGAILDGVHSDISEPTGQMVIMWGLLVTADGTGDIVITQSIAGPGSTYQPYVTDSYYTSPILELLDSDLGGAIIYAVPEPITMALLGLGGLFLRRRKK